MNVKNFFSIATDKKRLKCALKRSTAVRAAICTGLGNMGTAYAAGQPLKPLIGSTVFVLLGTIITKTFDEDLMADDPPPPPVS